ncbi:MAG: hypothetical protein J2O39_01595 [Acidimicrobiales bacterium]|nr:hypothetical protein [Acidimicrobiales bacterium]
MRVPPEVGYVPYHRLDGRPHLIVDGPATDGTVLTLSHWPASPTPKPLRADLSAEIVFRFLAGRRRWWQRPPSAVSNDHLDQDGLVSVFAIQSPEEALRRKELLCDLARAGDFAVFRHREAGRASFALATLADPERSPLGPAAFPEGYAERCAGLHEELLGRLLELVDDPGRHRALWAEEDDAFGASEADLQRGAVTVSELPTVDLAVVEVAEDARPRTATRFVGREDLAVHPAALHRATGCLRLLLVQGRRYRLTYRYESWVRLVSRPVAPRVDLGPLAARLEAEERGPTRWSFDGVGALVPSLRTEGDHESSLDPALVRAMVVEHLSTARPAWGPEGPVLEGGPSTRRGGYAGAVRWARMAASRVYSK